MISRFPALFFFFLSPNRACAGCDSKLRPPPPPPPPADTHKKQRRPQRMHYVLVCDYQVLQDTKDQIFHFHAEHSNAWLMQEQEISVCGREGGMGVGGGGGAEGRIISFFEK